VVVDEVEDDTQDQAPPSLFVRDCSRFHVIQPAGRPSTYF
jgi:hypothetical protein